MEGKKIEEKGEKIVTSSKRRSGIEKKSSKLETLCGAELEPVVDLVMPPTDNMSRLTRQHNELLGQLEAEQEKGRMWDQILATKGRGWWNKPTNQLSRDELKQINILRERAQIVLQQKLGIRDSNPKETSTSTSTTPNGNCKVRGQPRCH